MNKEMIFPSSGHETMAAILEDDLVTEIYIERERQRGIVGNVYKGRVSKVLPGMQSSFVDIGLERDAFLYVTEVINTVEEFERLESGEDEADVETPSEPAAVAAGAVVDETAEDAGVATSDAESAATVSSGGARTERRARDREGVPIHDENRAPFLVHFHLLPFPVTQKANPASSWDQDTPAP